MTKVYSRCGEVFNSDDPSDFEEGDTYYSGDKVDIKPSELLYSNVECIIDSMEEQLYERVGDVAEGSLSCGGNVSAEFEHMLQTFVDEHFSVDCYAVENIEEHVMEVGNG